MTRTYPSLIWSIGKENAYVDELYDKPNPVDGDDKEAIGMDKGQAVDDPEDAVHHGSKVRIHLKFLHRLVL